jgi:hypothetical protein
LKYLQYALIVVVFSIIVGGLGSVAWFSYNENRQKASLKSPPVQETVKEVEDKEWSYVLPEDASPQYFMQLMGMMEINTTETAPDFTLESITGESVTLSQYRGKVVLLSYWTTW